MQRRDRRLDDVRLTAAERERPVEHSPSLLDLVEIPERAILVAEEDDGSVCEPRAAAGIVEEHQRQQSVHLRLVGHQLGERPPEPDRLGR
jgi:hypothetical protein